MSRPRIIVPRPVANVTGPARVWLLTGAIALVGAGIHAALELGPFTVHPWPWFLGLAIVFAVAERAVVHLHYGRHAESWSLSEIPLVVGLVFAPPLILVAARIAGAAGALLLRRQPVTKLAFNLSLQWFETLVAIALWRLIHGDNAALTPTGWVAILGALWATDLLGTTLVRLALRLAGASPGRVDRLRTLTLGVIHALANASFGLLVVYVATVDVRATWTVAVVAFVLFLGYRAHGALRERHESLERITAFTEQVGRALDVDSVAEAVLRDLRRQLQADIAQLDLRPDDTGQRFLLTYDSDGLVVTAADAGLTSALLDGSHPHPVVLPKNGRRADDRRRLDAAGVRDAMVVPIANEDDVIGTLVVANRASDVGTFDRNDLRVFETLANHAGVALENGRLADQLRDQARRDRLTHLPNRTALLERAHDQLAGSGAAVLLLDLDHFKEVNDTLGHVVGDELLIEVGSRLVQTIGDAGFVARLGGDEFAILLPGTSDATDEALRIRSALRRPFSLHGMTLAVDASIGIALAPEHGTHADELIQHADVAMYLAKRSHRGIEVYEATRDPYSPERLRLVAELRAAVETSALQVHYQPKIDVATGAVEGAEALARWLHPTRGLIPPDEFIPIAEQTGLIEALTDHVLRLALGQCRDWQQRGLDLHIAVNISPRSLADPEFVGRIQGALHEAQLPAEALTLEITESILMSETDETVAVLQRLRDIGVRLSVDDLGTGYSSLTYLKRLPVDEVKIDRSFVRNLGTDPADEAIVAAIIELGHRLGKTVVAEGVEDVSGWARLDSLGCDLTQGYLVAKPMDAATFEAWFAAHRPAAFAGGDLKAAV